MAEAWGKTINYHWLMLSLSKTRKSSSPYIQLLGCRKDIWLVKLTLQQYSKRLSS